MVTQKPTPHRDAPPVMIEDAPTDDHDVSVDQHDVSVVDDGTPSYNSHYYCLAHKPILTADGVEEHWTSTVANLDVGR